MVFLSFRTALDSGSCAGTLLLAFAVVFFCVIVKGDHDPHDEHNDD